VDRCAVYVGIFGNDYGFEDAQGLSPTEREFRRATQKHKFRLSPEGTEEHRRDATRRAAEAEIRIPKSEIRNKFKFREFLNGRNRGTGGLAAKEPIDRKEMHPLPWRERFVAAGERLAPGGVEQEVTEIAEEVGNAQAKSGSWQKNGAEKSGRAGGSRRNTAEARRTRRRTSEV
jgi:hypothetical protein